MCSLSCGSHFESSWLYKRLPCICASSYNVLQVLVQSSVTRHFGKNTIFWFWQRAIQKRFLENKIKMLKNVCFEIKERCFSSFCLKCYNVSYFLPRCYVWCDPRVSFSHRSLTINSSASTRDRREALYYLQQIRKTVTPLLFLRYAQHIPWSPGSFCSPACCVCAEPFFVCLFFLEWRDAGDHKHGYPNSHLPQVDGKKIPPRFLAPHFLYRLSQVEKPSSNFARIFQLTGWEKTKRGCKRRKLRNGMIFLILEESPTRAMKRTILSRSTDFPRRPGYLTWWKSGEFWFWINATILNVNTSPVQSTLYVEQV